MKFQIELSGDAATALAGIIAADGYGDPQTWMQDYVRARLKDRVLAMQQNAAAQSYNATMAEAQATLDAAAAQAEQSVAAVLDAGLSVSVVGA